MQTYEDATCTDANMQKCKNAKMHLPPTPPTTPSATPLSSCALLLLRPASRVLRTEVQLIDIKAPDSKVRLSSMDDLNEQLTRCAQHLSIRIADLARHSDTVALRLRASLGRQLEQWPSRQQPLGHWRSHQQPVPLLTPKRRRLHELLVRARVRRHQP